MSNALYQSSITSLPLLGHGKVRDNYAVGDDKLLIVTTDRLSAFDVIMGEPIPGKGELLTQMALFWFDKLGHICPNHLTGDAPESVVSPEEAPQIRGRSMLVKRLQPIPVEAVVRGYLAGSGWKEYQESRSVCGVPLPEGLTNAAKLPEPIYTPAAKAAMGEHDENITFERTVEMMITRRSWPWKSSVLPTLTSPKSAPFSRRCNLSICLLYGVITPISCCVHLLRRIASRSLT